MPGYTAGQGWLPGLSGAGAKPLLSNVTFPVEMGGPVANLLEVKDLRTHIRMRHSTVEAVDGVSLTIAPGETVGLVGESGCGKSMTGMSIMRLLPPGGHIVGGTVKLNGRELTTLSDAEMRHVDRK